MKNLKQRWTQSDGKVTYFKIYGRQSTNDI